MRKKLFLIAVIGSLMGYCIVDMFLINIPFWKFFTIEVIITVMHMLYGTAKKDLLIKSE